MSKPAKAAVSAAIFILGFIVSYLLIDQRELNFSFAVVGMLVGSLAGSLAVQFWCESGVFDSFFRKREERR